MNIDDLRNLVAEGKSYKARENSKLELKKMSRVLMVYSGLIGLFCFLLRLSQPIEVTISLSILSVASIFASIIIKKKSNKNLVEIMKKRKEILDEIIRNEKEIMQLMNTVVPDKDINFSSLKFNFINKNYEEIIPCLNLLLKKWFEETYTKEEKGILSQYDIEMNLKEEKEINYTYKL